MNRPPHGQRGRMSYEQQRRDLVSHLEQRESLSDETLDAMRAVPRHAFVPQQHRSKAYRDSPLPIGDGQTISAPHMVAIMTELLELSYGDTVLEIGTGCGYHAAVTAEIVGPENVYSIEYHDSLARRARETLTAVGYGDISIRTGDGKKGWPEGAPFTAIYLTCAAPEFPPALKDQLAVGGRLLGPVGKGQQVLVRAVKQPDGHFDEEEHGYVRFVPLQ